MIGSLLHGKAKASAIKELAKERNIDLANSFAYSDSHHDFPLLESVGNPCAINPDTLLEIRAYRDNWPVYDFRKARKIKKFFGPIAGRVAGIAMLISPRRKAR
jgi:phosphoserine phosphatase